MPEHAQILQLVYRAVDEMNEQLPPGRPIVKSPETRLYGSQSALDSLGIVNLIVTVEREIDDEFGVALTLADERALSMKNSPFKSIQSLADYIQVLLSEASNA